MCVAHIVRSAECVECRRERRSMEPSRRCSKRVSLFAGSLHRIAHVSPSVSLRVFKHVFFCCHYCMSQTPFSLRRFHCLCKSKTRHTETKSHPHSSSLTAGVEQSGHSRKWFEPLAKKLHGVVLLTSGRKRPGQVKTHKTISTGCHSSQMWPTTHRRTSVLRLERPAAVNQHISENMPSFQNSTR